MKNRILLFTLWLLALPFCTLAHNDDTVRTFRVNIGDTGNEIIIKGTLHVNVIPDTKNYYELTDMEIFNDLRKLTNERNSKGNVVLEGKTGNGTIDLHIKMDKKMTISAEDYTVVNLSPCHTSHLTITATDYSKVFFVSSSDTSRFEKLSLYSHDYSSIQMTEPVVADTLWAEAVDYGQIVLDNFKANIFGYNTYDYAKVSTKNYQAKSDNELSRDSIVKNDNTKFQITIGSRNDFNFRFGWGFTNWGSQPLTGLTKMDGAYNLKTSFSSYQLEMDYNIYLRNSKWGFGIGLGYESDIYKFTNPWIAYTPPANGQNGSFDINDISGLYIESHTRLVTRYLTVPLTVHWRPTCNTKIALSLIPGLNFCSDHTGLKHTFEQTSSESKNRFSTSGVMNPYKLDARLTVGWSGFQIFLQTATIPVFVNLDQKIYPIKLGFIIELKPSF